MKRFYQTIAYIRTDNGFVIQADHKNLKSPKNNIVCVPSLNMGEVLVQEWTKQKDTINFISMPITQFVYTVLDYGDLKRNEYINDIISYARTDLLCYRVLKPKDLALKQNQLWQPVLNWVEESFEVKFNIVYDIMPVSFSKENETIIKKYLEQYNNYQLIAFLLMVRNCGSVILSLALCKKFITPEQAFDLALLDENYQQEKWGADFEFAKSIENKKNDFNHAVYFFNLSQAK
ncbi:MAG: hypothetical protein K1X44_03700 [Alphaproteobacteria bacterium]|nr:hypothetical protein [Alphaproteobacteria bacterium]